MLGTEGSEEQGSRGVAWGGNGGNRPLRPPAVERLSLPASTFGKARFKNQRYLSFVLRVIYAFCSSFLAGTFY